MLHATIAHNAPGDGCGLYAGFDSVVTLTNTIMASHTVGIIVTAGSTVTLEATLWGKGAWANERDWSGAGVIVTGTAAFNYWAAPAFVDPGNGD